MPATNAAPCPRRHAGAIGGSPFRHWPSSRIARGSITTIFLPLAISISPTFRCFRSHRLMRIPNRLSQPLDSPDLVAAPPSAIRVDSSAYTCRIRRVADLEPQYGLLPHVHRFPEMGTSRTPTILTLPQGTRRQPPGAHPIGSSRGASRQHASAPATPFHCDDPFAPSPPSATKT